MPKDLSFDKLKDMLKKHFNPESILIAERFYFYQRNQNASESMGNYLATLRRLASTCKFGDFLNDALRDQFVCEMLNEATQKVLITKSDLTLSKAVFVAQGMEAAALKSKELHAESNQYSTSLVIVVNAPAAAASRSHPCGRCVSGNHDPGACRYRTTTCHKYGKVGHIAPVCHSKTSGKPSRLPTKKTKWLSATTEPTEEGT